jgi:hypothetical protein
MYPPQCSAQLGLAARRHHLKFVHRIETIEDAAQAGGIVVRREAIDQKIIRKIALASHRDPLSGHR